MSSNQTVVQSPVANNNKQDAKQVSLQSPWVIYFKKVAELLSSDEEIEVSNLDEGSDDGVYSFTIASNNATKLNALQKILKNDIGFGNITLHIDFEYVSDSDEITAQDWEDAFEGNEHFFSIVTRKMTDVDWTYAVFQRDIITIYADDLTDYKTNEHFIAADIVKEISKSSRINVCTAYGEDEDEIED